MGTYRVEVSGWVTLEAPDERAARTTANQLHLSYESSLDAGVVPDEAELTTGEPRLIS